MIPALVEDTHPPPGRAPKPRCPLARCAIAPPAAPLRQLIQPRSSKPAAGGAGTRSFPHRLQRAALPFCTAGGPRFGKRSDPLINPSKEEYVVQNAPFFFFHFDRRSSSSLAFACERKCKPSDFLRIRFFQNKNLKILTFSVQYPFWLPNEEMDRFCRKRISPSFKSHLSANVL